MRRVLNQAANAAVKPKGGIFAIVYRRLVPRLGHAQAIGAITHRLCRLIWKILQQGVRYEERGPPVSAEAMKVRAPKMIRELRGLVIASNCPRLHRAPRHDRDRFSTLARHSRIKRNRLKLLVANPLRVCQADCLSEVCRQISDIRRQPARI
jgi:hypothetical protein